MLTEEILGTRVRHAREGAGLTQAELAKKIGVDQPMVSRFEKGRDIGSILLTKIAEVTGQELDFFLKPEQPIAGVLWKKGAATLEALDEAQRQMLSLIEDYESVRRLGD